MELQVTRKEYQAKIDSINAACDLRIEEAKVFYGNSRTLRDDAEWIAFVDLGLETQIRCVNNMREEEIYFFQKRAEIIE